MWARNLIVPCLILVMIWICLSFSISWSWSASVCNADWILIATPSAICDEVPSPDRCYFVTNNIATVVLRSGWWFLGQVWVTAVEVTRVSPAAQEWGGQSLVSQANVTFQFITSVKDGCNVLCIRLVVSWISEISDRLRWSASRCPLSSDPYYKLTTHLAVHKTQTPCTCLVRSVYLLDLQFAMV